MAASEDPSSGFRRKLASRREFLRAGLSGSVVMLLAACAPAAPATSPPTAAAAPPKPTTAPAQPTTAPAVQPTTASAAAPTTAPAAKPTAAAAAAPTTAPAAAAGQPRTGGTLRVNHPSTPRNLDPAKNQTTEDTLIHTAVYETLVWAEYDRSFKPLLAQSWDHSADLKTWTFKLQPGVKFHHGKVLDAQDVVTSVQRVLDPATGSQGRGNLDPISTVEAVDASTVKFNLKFAYGDLLAPLSTAFVSIVPADRIDKLSQEPSGTGPFMFKEIVQGDHETVVKNPNYWQQGKPYLDQVIFKEIPEPAARLTSVANGETDVMWFVPFEVMDQIKTNADLVLEEIPTTTFDPLVLDITKPPFDNPKVRLAIRYAINADQLVKVALLGHGTKVPIPISPKDPLFPNAPVLDQNYDKAKQLMAEAGYPNGFDMPIYAPLGREHRVRAAVAIADMLKPLNIIADVQQQPLDKFFADTEGHGQAYVDGWFDSPGVDMHLWPQFHTKGSWNELVWKWANPDADDALDKARASASVDERKQLYGKLAQILNDDGPGVIYWVSNVANAWRKNVNNMHTFADNRLSAREIWLSA